MVWTIFHLSSERRSYSWQNYQTLLRLEFVPAQESCSLIFKILLYIKNSLSLTRGSYSFEAMIKHLKAGFIPYMGSYSRGGFEPQKNKKFVTAKGELFSSIQPEQLKHTSLSPARGVIPPKPIHQQRNKSVCPPNWGVIPSVKRLIK